MERSKQEKMKIKVEENHSRETVETSPKEDWAEVDKSTLSLGESYK